MYAITGISGKVGSAAARALLAGGQPVRAVLRNPDKAKRWSDLGCEVAIAEMEDAAALTAAFAGSAAVFILPPSNFDPSPGFPEAQAVIFAVTRALRASAPARVVCLSTIGAQATQLNSKRGPLTVPGIGPAPAGGGPEPAGCPQLSNSPKPTPIDRPLVKRRAKPLTR